MTTLLLKHYPHRGRITKDDIFMRTVQKEDLIMHANDPEPEAPDNKTMRELLKLNRGNRSVGCWNFSRNIIKSLLP